MYTSCMIYLLTKKKEDLKCGKCTLKISLFINVKLTRFTLIIF